MLHIVPKTYGDHYATGSFRAAVVMTQGHAISEQTAEVSQAPKEQSHLDRNA
jgi:hypothetical protein